MKRETKHIILWGMALLMLFSGCHREEDWLDMPQNGGFLQIEGEIVGAGAAVSRAKAHDTLTISYNSFQRGDEIGFFSFHELTCDKVEQNAHKGNEDKDYLKNELLTYTGMEGTPKFISETVENITLSKLGLTFGYFPYSSYDTGSGDDLSKGPAGYVKKNDVGEYEKLGEYDFYLNIFRQDGSLEDFLTASKRQYFNVNYSFEHRFSMLLLYLGEGFNPETKGNEQLTIHLTEKILGAHVTRKWLNNNDEGFELTVDKVPVSEAGNYAFGQSEFIAIKTPDYIRPGTSEEETVYPVILPPGVEIDYIEVTDVSGMVQRVRPTKEALPGLDGGNMYPMTIKMTGLAPAIYPHNIIGWNEQEEIEVDKLPGIYDADGFKSWLFLYNKNVSDFSSISEEDHLALESYGEWNNKGWTFYLRDNIDCDGITADDGRGALIKELPDGVTLDGCNYVLSNLMLDFESKEEVDKTPTDRMVSMIGEIKGGMLRNLRVEFVTVRNLNPDIPSGCIAAKISGGQILECTVRQAAMMCRGVVQAGVLAGSITGGQVDNCKFHGMVQANVVENETYPNYKGVAGEITRIGDLYLYDIVNRVILAD